MNLMRYKFWYFIFSLLIIIPGLYFLVTSGLKLGIDFTGGALIEYRFDSNIDKNVLREEISKQGIEVGAIIPTGENVYIIKTKPLEQSKINSLKGSLVDKFGKVEE